MGIRHLLLPIDPAGVHHVIDAARFMHRTAWQAARRQRKHYTINGTFVIDFHTPEALCEELYRSKKMALGNQ